LDLLSPQQLTLSLAMIIGYLLGALPIADRISRRKGVDLFNSGTGLAGASNVRRTVGKKAGAIVMVADFAKGVAAVMVARGFGLDGSFLLLVAASAIIGHWNSIFSRFRGGDGLSSLAGVTVGLFPAFGYLSLLAAGVFSLLGHKLPHHSLLAAVVAYCSILAMGAITHADPQMIIGTGILCGLVLTHATWGHISRHRRGTPIDTATPTHQEIATESPSDIR
jgi:glycerol-3-phosphate acyltransferase PlsY